LAWRQTWPRKSQPRPAIGFSSPFSFRLIGVGYSSPYGAGHGGFIEKIHTFCYIDPSAQEPVMRKIIFVVAIAAAAVGAGVVVASLSNPELAAARCSSRC